jgi:hypothetical protein
MSVRDGRKPSFVWASTDALAHIEWAWNAGRCGKEVRRRIGFDVYLALLRIANGEKARTKIGAEASDQFAATHAEIAWRADVTPRYAEQACEELERIGLLAIEPDKDGDQRPGRPSFYTLTEPPQTYEESSYVKRNRYEVSSYRRPHRRTKPVRTPSEPTSDVSSQRTNSVRTSLYKGKKKQQKKEEGGGDRPVRESENATTAWAGAKLLLASRIPRDSFDTYIAPLEVAGERAGRLVLADSSEQGGGAWIDEHARPLILETLDGFDDFEILDEVELDRAGLTAAASTATSDPLAVAPTHIRDAAPTVLQTLTRIAEVKRCPFPATNRVVATMATYPDLDHRVIASDMADRLLEGTWKKRDVADVVAMYRSWLKREQEGAAERRPRGRQRGEEHPAERRIREIRERRGPDAIDGEAVEER